MGRLVPFLPVFLFFFSTAAFSTAENERTARKEMIDRLEHASTVLPRKYLEEVFASSFLRVDSTMIHDVKKRSGYLRVFLDSLFSPRSIARGKQFLLRFRDTLENIKGRFGVSPEVITAVLRVESDLGRNLGKYRAMNVYYTLYTKVYRSSVRKRAWVFREMRAFLEFCYTTFPHPLFPYFFMSSWSGAVGYCQFMPSNFHLAVDGDADGVVNIAESIPDALASAANFLKTNGYRNQPRTAVLRYVGGSMRTSGWYVNAVFKYARLIKTHQ